MDMSVTSCNPETHMQRRLLSLARPEEGIDASGLGTVFPEQSKGVLILQQGKHPSEQHIKDTAKNEFTFQISKETFYNIYLKKVMGIIKFQLLRLPDLYCCVHQCVSSNLISTSKCCVARTPDLL